MLSGSPRHRGRRVNGLSRTTSDQVAHGQVGIDCDHVLAVGHDLSHVHFGEIENAAQHVAVVLAHEPFARAKVEDGAQLVRRRRHAGARRPGGEPQDQIGERVDHAAHRRQERRQNPQPRRHVEHRAVGVADGVGLGQDLGEDEYQQRHDDRGVGHPGLAEDADHQAGRQRGRQDVDGVVAEQDGADRLFAPVEQADDETRAPVAGLGKLVQARARRRRQRGLGAGKERR